MKPANEFDFGASLKVYWETQGSNPNKHGARYKTDEHGYSERLMDKLDALEQDPKVLFYTVVRVTPARRWVRI